MAPIVHGFPSDDHTRCIHYHSEKDIIAIRFKCCNRYYPCHLCHQQSADHPAMVWLEQEWDTLAVLCGNCRHELSIREYKASGSACPSCGALFNPNCSLHDHLYFGVPHAG